MSRQKATKRKEQAARTKQRIFDVAIELMDKRGFNNMTIEDICEKAGVSVGTFYHYYESKEDVFFELYRKSDEYYKNVVTPSLEGKNMTTADKVVLYFKFYARYQTEQNFENARELYSTKNKFFIDESRYMIVYLMEIMEEGQNKNEIISDLPAREMAIDLFIVSRGIVFDWCIHEADYDLEEKMGKMIELFVSVFKK